MNKDVVAVLGGGSGAHMMAGHLALGGERVNMVEHPRFKESFHPLKTGAVEVSGIGPTGMARLNLATTDFAAGLKDARHVHVVMSAPGHELFFQALLPHVRDDHTIIVWAGNMAAVQLYVMLRQRRPAVYPSIFETNTLPYGTRLRPPGAVELLLWAGRVQIAGIPASLAPPLAALRKFFPQLERGPSVLATAFNNPNPTVHPAASLLNVGRIEYSKGDFYLYREGLTPAAAGLIRAVYDETAAVARAYGARLLRYSDHEFQPTASIMGAEFKAPPGVDSLAVIASIKGPSTLQDRYLTEDIPYGLVLRSEMGKIAGVSTPVIDGIIALGSVVTGINSWKNGRTLSRLGLRVRTRTAILALLRDGRLSSAKPARKTRRKAA